MGMHRVLIALLALVSALPAAAQFGPEFERILIPITSVDTPGAFGSLWRTELWCRNDGDEPARVMPLAQSDTAFPPHTDSQLPIFRASVGFPPGLFLYYVLRPAGAKLRFNLRTQDVSREAQTWGTEIPVVRENEFLNGALTLVNIPTDSPFRETLRIYALSDSATVVHIRVVPLRSATPLAEEDIMLRSGDAVGYVPAYAEISLNDRYPQLSGGQPVRLEIQAATTDLPLWAFVSVTNNETQQVTTVTPQ